MEWWDNMRRVWNGVASRLGIRKRGLLKLRHDVRASEYEDIRVMWEMLNRNETKNAQFSGKNKRTPFWKCLEWARCAPHFSRSYQSGHL